MRARKPASSCPPSSERESPSSCSTKESAADLNTLAGLVEDYISQYRLWRRSQFDWYVSAPSLAEAVERAALCKGPDGKRKSHQRRIPKATLLEAHERLLKLPFRAIQDFDAMHALVARTCAGLDRFGKLCCYDISTRIGAFLRIEPSSVYLHSGTQKGARALGLDHRSDRIAVSSLPASMQRLTAPEVEDFLCIYKSDIAALPDHEKGRNR